MALRHSTSSGCLLLQRASVCASRSNRTVRILSMEGGFSLINFTFLETLSLFHLTSFQSSISFLRREFDRLSPVAMPYVLYRKLTLTLSSHSEASPLWSFASWGDNAIRNLCYNNQSGLMFMYYCSLIGSPYRPREYKSSVISTLPHLSFHGESRSGFRLLHCLMRFIETWLWSLSHCERSRYNNSFLSALRVLP